MFSQYFPAIYIRINSDNLVCTPYKKTFPQDVTATTKIFTGMMCLG